MTDERRKRSLIECPEVMIRAFCERHHVQARIEHHACVDETGAELSAVHLLEQPAPRRAVLGWFDGDALQSHGPWSRLMRLWLQWRSEYMTGESP